MFHNKQERWAFSHSELDSPFDCKSDDELIAIIVDDDYDENSYSIIVYRNGEVSNYFDVRSSIRFMIVYGTVEIPQNLADLAAEVDTLLHPNGEETATWGDVLVDSKGRFICFR